MQVVLLHSKVDHVTLAVASKKKVLIVDGDQSTRRLLMDSFFAEGYEAHWTESGAEALVLAVTIQPSLILLDTDLPDVKAEEIIRVLSKHSSVGIIVLSPRDEESEKIAALDAGANDFVCKPLRAREVMARARSILRSRVSCEPITVYQAGPLTMDVAARAVTLNGAALRFTPKEFRVLHILASAQGRVVTQRQLIETLWGDTSADSVQYLRVIIGRLRDRIEKNPSQPAILLTERGVGYRLLPGEPARDS